MSDDRFLGVPADIVQAWGKVAIAAGRADVGLYLIAAALEVDPKRKLLSQLRRDIRARLSEPPPNLPTSLVERIERWLDQLVTVMKRRNEILHSALLKQGAHDVRVHEGRAVPVSRKELDDLVARLVRVSNEGWQIAIELRVPRGTLVLWDGFLE